MSWRKYLLHSHSRRSCLVSHSEAYLQLAVWCTRLCDDWLLPEEGSSAGPAELLLFRWAYSERSD